MTFLLLLLLLVAAVAVAGTLRPAWSSRRPARRVVEEVVYDEPVEVVEVVEEAAPRPVAPRHRRRRVVEY